MNALMPKQSSYAIFFSDVAFTDNTAQLLTNSGQARIPIHVLGMQVKGKDREEFHRIVPRNGGWLADVGVSRV